jgi:hypothetical protein
VINKSKKPDIKKDVPTIYRGLPEAKWPRIVVYLRESAPGRLSLSTKNDELMGVVELTDEEIIIYKKSIVRKKDRGVKHIRYDQITSIDYDAPKTLAFSAIQLYLTSTEYSLKTKSHRLKEFYENIRGKMVIAQSTGNREIPISNPLDDLKKLAELKDSGIITAEEFEAKKKQLLNL